MRKGSEVTVAAGCVAVCRSTVIHRRGRTEEPRLQQGSFVGLSRVAINHTMLLLPGSQGLMQARWRSPQIMLRRSMMV